ncbi:hypothetical protein [Lewinella sp. IMCC34183]|uniref:hypothetical protein n=1 Tax=Lewinella sp. IMCC34183 TaxID=2248762 RepID=UPI000E254687|nr:hypothetical protein [Lewinella sp. IMCC34183]
MLYRYLLLLLPVLLLTACPADLEVEPAFVTVDGFQLEAGPGRGAATMDVREVWAFADGEFIGVFPLPARIPLYRVGPVNLRLEAGIRQDGRSVTPDIYPFYTPFERSVDLQSGVTQELGELPVTYRPETVFGFVEDFEATTPRVFTEVLAGAGGITVQTDVVRSGAAAGAVILSDTSTLVEVATQRSYAGLSETPVNVWLEVDYRGDGLGLFGVVGTQGGLPVRVFDPGFLPRDTWTKLYVNLSPVVGSSGLAELRVALSTVLPPELARGTVYLDNLKLLYFPSR